VVIYAPTDQRPALCVQAARAGRPILVEKPVALTAADARGLAREIERSRTPALAALFLRELPALRQLRGVLGDAAGDDRTPRRGVCGFRERAVARHREPDGTTSRTQMAFADSLITIGRPSLHGNSPRRGVSSMLYIYVDDVDVHYQHANATGALDCGPPHNPTSRGPALRKSPIPRVIAGPSRSTSGTPPPRDERGPRLHPLVGSGRTP